MPKELQTSEEIYKRITKRKIYGILFLVIAVMIAFIGNLLTGSSKISVLNLVTTIIGDAPDVTTEIVFWKIRLPIALMAVIVGAALAVGGCAMQTILRNPMASPFTLGISSAAAFGAAAGIILDINFVHVPSSLLITMNSFLMALSAAGVIYIFASKEGLSKNVIILFGIALNFIFNALTMFLQYIADENKLQSLVFWSFGSLLKASWDKIAIITCVFICCFYYIMKKSWLLTALTFNDQKAASLGVNVSALRKIIILVVSLLTATAVCFVGTIGFVGLVAPHLARAVTGDDHRYLMPTAALLGATILSVAAIVSRLIVPGTVLPIGLITSLIGIPFFIMLIFKNRKGYL